MNLFHNQSISLEYKSLDQMASVVYSEFTTQTSSGNRNRNSSGIFLPEFYQSLFNGTAILKGVIHSLKLVTRATRGNKALSTNNTASLDARVEPLLHLFKSVQQVLLLTKHLEGISMFTYLFKAISRRDLGNTRKPINQMTVYTLKTTAESEEQARALFSPYYVILNGSSVNGGAVC